MCHTKTSFQLPQSSKTFVRNSTVTSDWLQSTFHGKKQFTPTHQCPENTTDVFAGREPIFVIEKELNDETPNGPWIAPMRIEGHIYPINDVDNFLVELPTAGEYQSVCYLSVRKLRSCDVSIPVSVHFWSASQVSGSLRPTLEVVLMCALETLKSRSGTALEPRCCILTMTLIQAIAHLYVDEEFYNPNYSSYRL